MEPLRARAWAVALCVAAAAAATAAMADAQATTEEATATPVGHVESSTVFAASWTTEGAPSAPAPRLLLNKCCGPRQILDGEQQECMPHENATRDAHSEEEETVAALASRPYPWWLDSRAGGVKRSGRILKLLEAAAPHSVVRYGKRPCGPELTAVFWRKEALMFSNGSLKVNITLRRSGSPTDKSSKLLPPELFCVDKSYVGKELHFVYLACPCGEVPCVRKCCTNNYMMAIPPAVAMNFNAKCVRGLPTKSWNATLVQEAGAGAREPANVSYALLPGPFTLTCAAGRTAIPLHNRPSEEQMAVLANGSLFGKVSGSPFLPHEYCVDHAVSEGVESFTALVCAKNSEAKPMRPISAVYVVLYCVGVTFLLATLAVYALLPSLRRPANAKALMCHIAAWAVALAVLCASRFLTQVEHYSTCAAMAFTAQFFLLASFFWLTVLCFDIARGFSAALRPLDHSAGAACRRVLLYSLFACGGPALIVAVSVAFNYARSLPSWVLRPGIGEKGCWFTGTASILAYYYGPVAVLLLANSVMFYFTMMQLRVAQRETSVLKNAEGHLSGGALRRRRERLVLYAKLYSLMGVTWLLEVVAWAAGADEVTFFVVDSVNVLRGVGVFVACCCKRGVLSSLDQRLRELCPCCPKRGRERGLSYTVTTVLSSSSADGARR